MRTRDYGASFARVVPVGLAVIQAMMLAPLFRPGAPAGADLTIHLAEIAHFVQAFGAGDLDLWVPTGNLGYAGAFYYQSLPQLVTAGVVWLLGADLLLTFKVAIALPLILLPLAVFRGLRIVGAPPTVAAGGAFAATFTFVPWPWHQWSIGFDSMFVPGLFTQAWGTLFYPLALGSTIEHLRHGRRLGRATIWTVLTGLCHPFLAISLVPAILVTGLAVFRHLPSGIIPRALRLLVAVLISSAFFWLPILLHYDDFGAFPFRHPEEAGLPLADFAQLLRDGTFLDDGRLPILQLALVAAVVRIFFAGSPLVRALLLQGLVFLVLLIAGPLLGDTNDNLLSPARFIPAMQLALACAAGATIVDIATWIVLRRPSLRLATVAALLLLAAYAGRAAVDRAQNARVRVIGDFDWAHPTELSAMTAALAKLPEGRVLGRTEAHTGSHFWMYLPSIDASHPAVRSYGGAARQSAPSYAYLHEDLDVQRHMRVYAIRYLLDKKLVDHPTASRLDVHRSAIDPTTLSTLAETKNATVTIGPVGYRTIQTTPEHYGALRHEVEAAATSTRTTWSLETATATVRYRTALYVLSELPIRGYFDIRDDVEPLPETRARRRSAALTWLAGEGPTTWSTKGDVIRERTAPSLYAAGVRIDGDQPRWVTLSVNHHVGWRATIDGQPAQIARILPAMMAIRVAPGTHAIVFVYHRPAEVWWLLGVAIVMGIVLAFRSRAA